MSTRFGFVSAVVLGCLLALPVRAEIGLAILDFELNDLTLQPRTPDELRRTASLKPLLERSLGAKGRYRIVAVDAAAQAMASKGQGYLSEHPDEAAMLGNPNESRFIVVGMLSKPSFLFSYVEARLVDVRDRKVVGDFYVEVKGQQDRFTSKGVENLAGQIDAWLQSHGQTE